MSSDSRRNIANSPISKSATNSPIITPRCALNSPTSLSVSCSPNLNRRTNKFAASRCPEIFLTAAAAVSGKLLPAEEIKSLSPSSTRHNPPPTISTAESQHPTRKSNGGLNHHHHHHNNHLHSNHLHSNHHHQTTKIPTVVSSCSNAAASPSSDSSDGKRTPPKKHLSPCSNISQSSPSSTTTTATFGNKLTPANRNHHHHHHHHAHPPPTHCYSSFKGNAHYHNLKSSSHASPSLRSLRTHADDRLLTPPCHGLLPPSPSLGSFVYADTPPVTLKHSDGVSVKSLVSIGMGSTDGRKLVIRRVPTSPTELLNIANPPPDAMDEDDEFSSYSSLSAAFPDFGPHYKPRGRQYRWSNKLQFILACVGYSIGLGNLWRLPYLCYKSGGSIFFIPYFIILLLCGVPLLYMELAIGQFTRRGPIGALSKLCPLLKGVGLSGVAVSFFLSTYYNVIIAYTLFYLFSAFRAEVPWDSCNNRWNTPKCWKSSLAELNRTKPPFSKTSAEEFYTKKVLQISEGIHEFGEMRWELMACLLIVWILVYFALWKSVRSSGKVLYFTASIPFVLVFVFLGYSLGLQGADKGIEYLLTPKWDLLLDSKVWINAAAQNLNSIGIAFGSVVSFASYNKYNNQILHDTIAVSVINAITSVLVAVFAFSTIGNIAWEQGTSIDDVITDGPGLAFVVYPQALSKIPFVSFWSALFFFTLLCLSLNSQFAVVEVVVTSVQDGFPNWIKRKLVCHEILVLVVCVVSFFIGLPHVSQGGMFFFQLIDYYVASIAIIYVAFFEVIAVAWIYGANRLSNDIEKMTMNKPCFFLVYCWKIATPLILMCIWLFSLLDYEPLTYNNDEYKYPVWAQTIGWLMALGTLSCIPILAIYVILHSEGNTFYEKLFNSLTPRLEDYGSHHSDDLHDTMKDNTKELNTLLNYKMTVENNQKNFVPESLPNQNHH